MTDNNKKITFPTTVCTNRIDFQEFSLVKQRKKKKIEIFSGFREKFKEPKIMQEKIKHENIQGSYVRNQYIPKE